MKLHRGDPLPPPHDQPRVHVPRPSVLPSASMLSEEASGSDDAIDNSSAKTRAAAPAVGKKCRDRPKAQSEERVEDEEQNPVETEQQWTPDSEEDLSIASISGPVCKAVDESVCTFTCKSVMGNERCMQRGNSVQNEESTRPRREKGEQKKATRPAPSEPKGAIMRAEACKHQKSHEVAPSVTARNSPNRSPGPQQRN